MSGAADRPPADRRVSGRVISTPLENGYRREWYAMRRPDGRWCFISAILDGERLIMASGGEEPAG